MLPRRTHLLRRQPTVPPASGSHLPGRDRCRRDEVRARCGRCKRQHSRTALPLARVPAAIGLATNPGDRKAAALIILLAALAKAIKTSRAINAKLSSPIQWLSRAIREFKDWLTWNLP